MAVARCQPATPLPSNAMDPAQPTEQEQPSYASTDHQERRSPGIQQTADQDFDRDGQEKGERGAEQNARNDDRPDCPGWKAVHWVSPRGEHLGYFPRARVRKVFISSQGLPRAEPRQNNRVCSLTALASILRK